MRIPIAHDLVSRDGTLGGDAGTKNVIIEVEGEASAIRNRPGAYDLGSAGTGTAQVLACYNGELKSIVGNTLADLSVTTPSSGIGEVHVLPTTTTQLWTGVAYGNGIFLAKADGTRQCAYSTDGKTWTQGTNVGFTTDGFWKGVAFGAGLFVAMSEFDSTGRYTTSPDGVTWTTRTFPALSGSVSRIRFINDLFVVGISSVTGPKLYTSPDGITWTARTVTIGPLSSSAVIVDSSYGNGKYAFHTFDSPSSHYVSTTEDFVSWTHTLVSYSGYNDILFDSGNFILPSRAYSSDGVTWFSASGIPAGLDEETSDSVGGQCMSVLLDALDIQYTYSSTDGGASWSLVSTLGEAGNLHEWVAIAGATINGDDVFVAVSDTSDDALFAYGPALPPVVTVDSSQAVTSIAPSLEFFAEVAGQAQSQNVVVFKNSKEAWYYDGTTLTKITDPDYPGWSTVTPVSITRSGTTATVTLPSPVNWQSGSTVTVAGAVQTQYNGNVEISVTDSTHFTYTVSGSPATPATGTITATGGRTTVPGIVYLDGYFFVMDEDAVIYGCELGDVTDWNALNFIAANTEPGSGIAITKSRSYVIALKAWSTEFFYDAGNAVGSPLTPIISSFSLVGCASGSSVVRINDSVMWVSKTRQRGRSVHVMEGLEQRKISTTSVDRILNTSSLANVYAYGIGISGHMLYVLGLVDLDITLVYDIVSGVWGQWTSLTARTSKSCTITSANGIATVVCAGHGIEDGDPATIAGANQSEYNGIQQMSRIDGDTLQFVVSTDAVTPATGTITLVGYDESYFKFTKYVNCGGRDLVLHESNGHLYEMSDAVYVDGAAPINMVARTSKFDGGNNKEKTNSRLEVIGNRNGGVAMMRRSDNDYESNSLFRFISLDSERPALRRLGSFKRRSFEFRHVTDSPVQASELEIEVQ